MRRKHNILNVVEHHINRVLPDKWWKCLKDSRYRKNKEWNFGYVMEVLLAGALSGCKTLREIETLSELYDERIPDTTLHDIMAQLNPEGLRAELAKGVKQALRSHELPKDELPVRITAIDGKYLYNTRKPVSEMSEPIGGGGANKMFRHLVLRAMHVSSETKLCLGQREIPCKGAESKEFIPFIDDLQNLYGRTDLLEVISVDAGMTGKDNANKLIKRGLHYIMALKGSQPTLHSLAQKLMQERKPDAVHEEIYNGKTVIRRLYRVEVSSAHGWSHLRELWKIEKIVIDPVTHEESAESRLFMTSLEPSVLSAMQVLQAIRMHWGIENNANWCLDVNFSEDTAPWTSKASVLVAYLRMMAFNCIERLKNRRLKAKQHRALAWKDFFLYFQHTLCKIRTVMTFQGTATPAFV